MSAEVFFVPTNDVATLTAAKLQLALEQASLPVKIAEEDGLLWIEFVGFESRLLTSPGAEPLDLITLQFYGDPAREEALLEKLTALLESHGYCNGEDLSSDGEA